MKRGERKEEAVNERRVGFCGWKKLKKKMVFACHICGYHAATASAAGNSVFPCIYICQGELGATKHILTSYLV